ncbi:MAG: MBL fold metallo-hydrolase [Deltaproteobacteria bacterium]|nr:MBL fold metallo-hydrolase [Deltaproteobacteria bacterium]
MRRLIGCVLLMLVGCERAPRVPYIPPVLHNWPAAYRGVEGLRLEAFVTGWLHLPEALVYRGGRWTTRTLPVLAFAIHHPQHGVILFGSGLNRAVAKNAGRYFDGLLGLVLQAEAYPELDLPAQLLSVGITPASVRWIILPSLQFDSTGEVEAFPEARVVVARAEHEYARNPGLGYLRREYDDVASWWFIDFPLDRPLATFPASTDLFEDGSCALLDVAGYTPGSLALLLRLASAPLLLAGNLAPVEETLRYAAPALGAADAAQWWDRIWRLKRFRDLEPALRIAPGHDTVSLWRNSPAELVLHDSTLPRDAPPRQRP